MAETSANVLFCSKERAVPRGSLRTSFSWTFAGNAVYSGCQWGILILLAKLGSPEVVGQYAIAFAIVTPIIFFTNLQLRSIIASDTRGAYNFGEYLGFRLVSIGVALGFIAVVALSLRYDVSTTWLILLVGLAQVVEALSDVLYARLQYHDRMDQIARSQMARGLLSLSSLAAAMLLTGELVWGILGLVLARAAVFLLVDLRALPPTTPHRDSDENRARWRRELRPQFVPCRMGRLLVLALPLGIVSLLVSFTANVPRYSIEHSLGRSALGIFSALAFLMSAGNLLVSALSQAAFVRMAVHFSAGQIREFRRLLLRLLGVGTALGLGGVLVAYSVGPQLLSILYTPEYAREPRVLVGLMVVAWLGYLAQFFGSAMTAAQYFRSQIPLFAIVVAVVALCSYWTIPVLGLSGAVLSLLIGVIVQIVGSAAIVRLAMRSRHNLAISQIPAGQL